MIKKLKKSLALFLAVSMVMIFVPNYLTSADNQDVVVTHGGITIAEDKQSANFVLSVAPKPKSDTEVIEVESITQKGQDNSSTVLVDNSSKEDKNASFDTNVTVNKNGTYVYTVAYTKTTTPEPSVQGEEASEKEVAPIKENLSTTLEVVVDGIGVEPEPEPTPKPEPAKEFEITDGTLTKYNGSSTDVTIPSEVTTIAGEAFKDSKITSVKMPTVVNVASNAFINCVSLHTVEFGSSLQTIGSDAFVGCNALTNVIIYNGEVTIGGTIAGTSGAKVLVLCQSKEEAVNANINSAFESAFTVYHTGVSFTADTSKDVIVGETVDLTTLFEAKTGIYNEANETITNSGFAVPSDYTISYALPAGYTGALTIENNMLTTNVASDETVLVKATCKDTTKELTVHVLSLAKIAVKQKPNKTTYRVGDTFDATGLILTLTYGTDANVTTKEVVYSEDTANDFAMAPTKIEKDTKEVKITYGGKEAVLPITVETKTLTTIGVASKPQLVDYVEGQTFNPKGLALSLSYDDMTTSTVTYGEDTKAAFGFDIDRALVTSDTQVTISYGGKTVTLPITVVAKSVSEIKVKTAPKTKYVEGQKFNPEGLELELLYNDKSTETIAYIDGVDGNASDFTFTPSVDATLTTANDTVTIKYIEKTVPLAILVEKKQLASISVQTPPTKTEYVVGESFDPTGLVITLQYNNGDIVKDINYSEGLNQESLYASKFSFSPSLDALLTVANSNVTITYTDDGQSAKVDLPITVKDKEIKSIAVETSPTRIKYVAGDTFDPSGLAIKVTYGDNTEKVIAYQGNESDFSFAPSKGTELTASDKKVTITYGDKTVDQDISVLATDTIESITVEQSPELMHYIAGQKLKAAGLVINVHYNDNTPDEKVTYSEDTKDLFTLPNTPLTVGMGEVEATYGGKSFTITGLSVEAKVITAISVLTEPKKTEYVAGQIFAPDALVLTATYNDGSSKDIAYTEATKANFAFSVDGTVLTGPLTKTGIYNVTITYSEDGKEVTNVQSITVVERKVVKIEVTTTPNIKYVEGQKFDPDGLIIKATYNDESFESITYSADTASMFSFTPTLTTPLTKENTEVMVEYAQATTKLPITVVDKQIESITVKEAPMTVVYTEGEVFDPTGLVLTVHYNDKSTVDVAYNQGLKEETIFTKYFSFSPSLMTPLTTDDKKVEITYTEETPVKVNQAITVNEKEVDSIAVKKAPNRVKYVAGSSFDPTGLEIQVNYVDGTNKILSYQEHAKDITFSPTLSEVLQAENQNVTISYRGKTIDQGITVLATDTIQEIKVTTPPTLLTYKEGQIFDPSGLAITVTYNDGTLEQKVVYDEDTKDFFTISTTPLTVGTTQVTIGYGGKEATIENIVVQEKTVTSASVKTNPKVLYTTGDMFDPTGLVLIVEYDNGKTEEIAYTSSNSADFTFSVSEPLTTTDTSVTVTYKGVALVDEIVITVSEPADVTLSSISVATNPDKTAYIEGQKFDPTGLALRLTYSDGSDKVVTYQEHSADFTFVPTLDTVLTTNVNHVSVSYQEKTVDVAISVAKKQLQSIVVKKEAKNKYVEGNTFDPTGLVLSAVYDNGQVEEIVYSPNNTNFTFSPSLQTKLQTTTKEITIQYLDKKTTQPIQVANNELDSISVVTAPTKVNYVVGQTFDPSGLVIREHYTNGTTKDIAYTNANMQSFVFTPTTFTTAGSTTINIQHSGKQTAIRVMVEKKAVASISVKTPPKKVEYLRGEEFEAEGLVIQVTYNDGSQKMVVYKDAVKEFTITPSKLAIKDTNVTIQYGGKTTTQKVTVKERVITSISVLEKPTKLKYKEGEIFAPEGLILTLEYEDGLKVQTIYNESNKASFSFSPTPLSLEDTKVTIGYGGKQTTINVLVVSKYENAKSESSDKKVSVEGNIASDFKLSIYEVDEHTKNILEQAFDGKDIIGSYEVSVSGSYEGKLKVTFTVDSQYNGRLVYIKHLKADGSIEDFKEVIQNNTVSIYVEEFSPFMLAIDKTANITTDNVDSPKDTAANETNGSNRTGTDSDTGDHTMDVYVLAGLMVLSGGTIICTRKRRSE